MTDPDCRATMDVLTASQSPALFTDENLLASSSVRMVNLSLEHGNSDASCLAYVWLGMVLGPHFGDYEAGFRFGKLGFDLVEKRGLLRFKARVYSDFGAPDQSLDEAPAHQPRAAAARLRRGAGDRRPHLRVLHAQRA